MSQILKIWLLLPLGGGGGGDGEGVGVILNIFFGEVYLGCHFCIIADSVALRFYRHNIYIKMLFGAIFQHLFQ